MDKEAEKKDMVQDEATVDQGLSGFVQELMPILEMFAQKINYLEDRLENQLIKGLADAYENKNRMDTIGRLKGAYGEKFGPLITALGGAHGADPEGFWGSAYDKLKELGIGHEGEGDIMDQMHGHLSGIHAKMLQALQGMGASPETGAGEPEAEPAATVKVEAAGEPEAVAEGVEKAAEETKKVAEKPAVGSAEFFKKHAKGSSTSKARK